MNDGSAALGEAAKALLDGGSPAWGGLDPEDVRDGLVDLVQAQEASYLQYGMPEIDIALVRALRLGVEGIDTRLIAWLAARPSTARLGVVCRALWQVWSPVNPHPPIDPGSVRMLMAAGTKVVVGDMEIGAYRSALEFAAEQVEDAGLVAAIDQALTHRTAPDAT